MNLCFNKDIAKIYKSKTQQVRVMSEDWLRRNINCPICGAEEVKKYENNKPVADFYCNNCTNDFELKAKNCIKISSKIADGAYETMVSRILSLHNPNFLFMTYKDYTVYNLVLIPNHFFTPSIIEKRKPLAPTAKRAGWIGCNINISNIPDSGKIYIIKNKEKISNKKIVSQYAKIKNLRTNNINKRGWLLDTLNCIEKISDRNFTLKQVYKFEDDLKTKYPKNNFIKDKLRQQLQYLRDKGFIEFLGNGYYRKLV